MTMRKGLSVFITVLLAINVFCGTSSSADKKKPSEPAIVSDPVDIQPWLEGVADIPQEMTKIENIAALRGFPASTNYYKIDPEVATYGFFYVYYVSGHQRDYIVTSTRRLFQLCHELERMGKFKETDKGGQFLSSAGNSVKGVATGLGSLIVHPGQSFKALGNRLERKSRSLDRALTGEGKIGAARGGENLASLGDGPAGAARREFAAKLGVDVYTANPDLRALLNEVGRLRTAGSFTTMVIPYALGSLSAFNPLSHDAAVEEKIRANDSYELRRLVGEDMKRYLNPTSRTDYQLMSTFLRNPNLTPRQVAYIWNRLVPMTGVSGWQSVLEVAGRAESTDHAEIILAELELLNYMHLRIRPLSYLLRMRRNIAAVGQNGTMYCVWAFDSIRPWSYVGDSFAVLKKAAEAYRCTGVTLMITGDVDPKVVAAAQAEGVEVRDNILSGGEFIGMLRAQPQ